MTVKYTKDHEWVSVDGTSATVGITAYAADQLGDVVFVELPAIGKTVSQGGDMAVVESVKAASDVYAPISGTVSAVNDALSDTPEAVNAGAEGDGWFAKLTLSNPAELDSLMDRAAYDAFLASL
jgi:glycine cleavage system H protein